MQQVLFAKHDLEPLFLYIPYRFLQRTGYNTCISNYY